MMSEHRDIIEQCVLRVNRSKKCYDTVSDHGGVGQGAKFTKIKK
jgi:hypothetical protein